jgi:hypothetical protein
MIENKDDKDHEPKIRLNLILHGTPAKILRDLRKRGIIRSFSDGVNTAIQVFYDKTLEQDLRSARLATLEESQQEDRE